MRKAIFLLLKSAMISIIPIIFVVLIFSYFIEGRTFNSLSDVMNGALNHRTLTLFVMVMLSEVIRLPKTLQRKGIQ